MRERSASLFERAEKVIPGGVNSPVRAFRAVGGDPVFIRRAGGARVYDCDGNSYVDYLSSWGPLILGHAHPAVVEAITRAAADGTSYGLPTEREVEMAETLVAAFPSMDQVRLVSSGTEATMSALRLARAFTGRDGIVKFEGGYHGHGDALLAKAGSGLATFGIPGSPGVPRVFAELTATLPYNDEEAVRAFLESRGDTVAAVIVEPVAGNMGVVPPVPGFLESLRDLTAAKGIVLIFDEVITGFRLAFGGCQTLSGIAPDLTCLGKIVGGGLPVGAFGGKREIMEMLAPAGPVYQAGTLSGNPLAVAAGLAVLKILKEKDPYEDLERKTAGLCGDLSRIFEEGGIPVAINRAGSMFTVFFQPGEVRDFSTASKSDTVRFSRFFRAMAENGVLFPPSQFETAFLSVAHGTKETDRTLEACRRVVKAL